MEDGKLGILYNPLVPDPNQDSYFINNHYPMPNIKHFSCPQIFSSDQNSTMTTFLQNPGQYGGLGVFSFRSIWHMYFDRENAGVFDAVA
jgi:hypothetical protein